MRIRCLHSNTLHHPLPRFEKEPEKEDTHSIEDNGVGSGSTRGSTVAINRSMVIQVKQSVLLRMRYVVSFVCVMIPRVESDRLIY